MGGSKTILIGNLVQNQFTTARDWPFGAAVSMVLMAVAMLLLFAVRRRGEELVMKRGLAVYAVVVYAFLHVPLLILAVFSFNASRFTVWQGFSLHWYRAMFADRDLLESAGNSLIIAIVVDRACDRHRHAGGLRTCGSARRRGWPAVLYLSLVTPEIVTGVSLLALFQWVFRFCICAWECIR